jgi:FtsP/CotA-like multicopper oxidase with cupredoxin domain
MTIRNRRLCAPVSRFGGPPRHRRTHCARDGMSALIVGAALGLGAGSPALAQNNAPSITPPSPSEATSPTVPCADLGKDLVMPPVIDASNGVLKGDISLVAEFQRLPPTAAGNKTCPQQLVRVYKAGLPSPPAKDLQDPMPGPTLRARVGDLVQLRFVNAVDPNRFDWNFVRAQKTDGTPNPPNTVGCMEVAQSGTNGNIYPGTLDTFPNCLHASSTANIHFHGTHTNPGGTGDNVFLQILPLPRDNVGNLTTTPEQAMIGLDNLFEECAKQLKNPLNQWPSKWYDIPGAWIDSQIALLKAYQEKNQDQDIWDADKAVNDKGGWPQYYIGATPYCFVLPHKPENEPVDKGDLRMGQAPGTQWYHSHKHGSTAINVMNGMTGAFIIEGQYDDDLNSFYNSYTVKRGADSKPWSTRDQSVLVLNQLGTVPNLLTSGGGRIGQGGVPFTVNGRVAPMAHMQPGEVQLWRIVNSSSRNALYFMPPNGLEWRQTAQDGVQFAQSTYASAGNQNRPFYLAPANRVDLLVQAPMTARNFTVVVQPVMARSQVQPTPVHPNTNDPAPGTALMTVDVSGDPVTQNGQPITAPMPFPPQGKAPKQPEFLADITRAELERANYSSKTFVFDSKAPTTKEQHTINGVQFEDQLGKANVNLLLDTVEEWTIKNTTNAIDHPFHIHINPFQITEVFDPNENLTDAQTGALLTQLQHTANGQTKIMTQEECDKLSDGTHCKTIPVPRYVTDKAQLSDPNNPFRARQCFLDEGNENTWSVAGACGPQPEQSNRIWWDTFAIPSARPNPTTPQKPIAGYFKMRSRFVDYSGAYVMHCHILVHEDRGMMFTVEVSEAAPMLMHHH